MQSRTSKSQKRPSSQPEASWNGKYNSWVRGAPLGELKAAAVARRFLGSKHTKICGSVHFQRQELKLPEVLS